MKKRNKSVQKCEQGSQTMKNHKKTTTKHDLHNFDQVAA